VRENRVRKVIGEGRVALGMTVGEFATRGVAKLIEFAELDYINIDMEHSGFSVDRVADLISWIKATDMTPFVRLPENLSHFIASVMDAGAMGVQVSNIETADAARAIVNEAKYTPLGNRGVGLVGPHTDFRPPRASEYLPFANRENMVIAAIESAKGLENLEQIVSVEGIDALNVGRSDITASLGIPGQYDNPRFVEAMQRVGDICRRHGKILRTNPENDAEIDQFYAIGSRMMNIGSDFVRFRNAVKTGADHVRERIAALK
jgi:2-keto-3-deoxy-L-rhamnonate aldolase RhmA